MYKLVAIDIDGTLINDQRELTQEVYNEIQRVRDRGVKVVLCTGRPINGALPFAKKLNMTDKEDYIITFNGALVQNISTKEPIAQIPLSYNDLIDLYHLSLQLETPMHFFDKEAVYTPNRDISHYTLYEAYANEIPLRYRTVEEIPKGFTTPKVMFIDDPEKLDITISKIPEPFRERYAMVKSAPFFYEILHPEVSKGNAVKQLAERLSIKREEVICIGDGGNDLSMIEYAGCGVAMANAVPEVKAIAQFQTKSNNEHGVAYALQQLIP